MKNNNNRNNDGHKEPGPLPARRRLQQRQVGQPHLRVGARATAPERGRERRRLGRRFSVLVVVYRINIDCFFFEASRRPSRALPLATKTMSSVGSLYEAACRSFREPTNVMVFCDTCEGSVSACFVLAGYEAALTRLLELYWRAVKELN